MKILINIACNLNWIEFKTQNLIQIYGMKFKFNWKKIRVQIEVKNIETMLMNTALKEVFLKKDLNLKRHLSIPVHLGIS
jgi:hypothetical protein